MNPDNFLDIWDIWVNELIGSEWLFIFLGLAIILYISIKNKIGTDTTIIFSILFLAAVFSKSFNEVIWVLIVFGVGVFFYFRIQRLIRRG